AVGRGGVLDLAIAQVDPSAHLTLHELHRFTTTSPAGRVVQDTTYAALTLDMRTGQDPAAVFDALAARGNVRLHPDDATMRTHLAATAAAAFAGAEQVAIVANTREQTTTLNAAIRERLVADGHVDDTQVVTTMAGQRIGVGDRIATRRNDPGLEVANRDTWTVTAIGPRGALTVEPAGVTPAAAARRAAVTPHNPQRRVLPPTYIQAFVELAYASTAYGVQGDTVTTAHIALGPGTGASTAYVGMTRGRQSNTAHLVADSLAEAREQWIAVFTRDRTDLGPSHAAERATREAARYGHPRAQQEEHLKVAYLTSRRDAGRHIPR
ncbi:MAG: trwC8, partial [Modestobacter sp.]|nr:trwC8 [Modestobacter sp.]